MNGDESRPKKKQQEYDDVLEVIIIIEYNTGKPNTLLRISEEWQKMGKKNTHKKIVKCIQLFSVCFCSWFIFSSALTLLVLGRWLVVVIKKTATY